VIRGNEDKMAETYSDFADVYDELMDDTPYEEWCETLVSLIEKYGISKPVRGERALEPPDASGTYDELQDALAAERNLVVDLGCGTGTLTELLYRKGYDMIGVDNSSAMLGIAMDKKAKSNAEILYLLQDMRELELYSTVGTVISVCDSVNYILETEELSEVFRLVNNYLYPGGLFVFDFNTDYKYRYVIGDTTIAENREDCSFIWENFYDAGSCLNEYDVTVFVREEGELFRRFTETHLQRGYNVELMKNLVEGAGMRILEILDADTLGAVNEESERVYMVAREQGKGQGKEQGKEQL
jgi:SAM-dependent methyltransferase